VTQPMPLDYIDHAEVERMLDAQLGLAPPRRNVKRERAWLCLAGEAELVCGHPRIDRSGKDGLVDVVCLTCGHEWMECEG
jgi:hypothetical protein